jgi:Domain of unknown function (DUF397)
MDAADLSRATWRKSSYSNGGGECVEVADLSDGTRALRDSKNPDDGVLIFDRESWASFVAGIKAGQFS